MRILRFDIVKAYMLAAPLHTCFISYLLRVICAILVKVDSLLAVGTTVLSASVIALRSITAFIIGAALTTRRLAVSFFTSTPTSASSTTRPTTATFASSTSDPPQTRPTHTHPPRTKTGSSATLTSSPGSPLVPLEHTRTYRYLSLEHNQRPTRQPSDQQIQHNEPNEVQHNKTQAGPTRHHRPRTTRRRYNTTSAMRHNTTSPTMHHRPRTARRRCNITSPTRHHRPHTTQRAQRGNQQAPLSRSPLRAQKRALPND